MKKVRRSRKRRKRISPRTKKRIVIISIVSGIILGLLFWFFVSRCKDEECFFHYVPLGEILVSVFFFGTLPFIFFDDEKK